MLTREAVISFSLAVAIVMAGVWLASLSLHDKEFSRSGARANAAAASRGTVSELGTHGTKAHAGSAMPAIASQAASAPSGIVRCAANGRVIYSDKGCPDGAVLSRVALHDSAGFVSPPKETVEELAAKRHAREQAYAMALQQQVSVQQPQAKSECEVLEQHIAYLDSVARQPQSARTQDWIRQERATARDRQFALRCR